MSNLLPPEIKAQLKWQKRTRVAVTFALMWLFGLLLANAALLPVAIYSNIVNTMVDEGGENIGNADLGKQRQVVTKSLKENKGFIDTVAQIAEMPRATTILDKAVSLISAVEGAELRSIALTDNEGNSSYNIHMSGVASSRASVVALKEIFEQDSELSIAEFPLGNLTPRGGTYNFTMDVTAKK